MDAVRFGRWISERRRKCGWRSQRALVDTVCHDPLLSGYKISEDFLASLEAGRLALPFRGSVRKRVLALAWILCKTPRDVHSYLHAAELTELSADETEQMNRLRKHLATQHTPNVSLLPPRPRRFLGRASLLNEVVNTLCTVEASLCAITGMPGVGKSALAYEALHLLASNERLHSFPDGIAAFTCTGRRGMSGLIALLNEIIAVFCPSSTAISPVSTELADDDLAGTINRVRIALADKRVLLLLDDLDTQFPLRQALEALLAHDQSSTAGCGGSKIGCSRHVVLITSRYVPPPALVPYHFRVGPLEPGAALELFTDLIGHLLSSEERIYGEQICAAVGYLPLAIELAASAVAIKAIPLSLLAARVVDHPLDRLLDDEGVLRSILAQALGSFEPGIQKRFALLSVLGAQPFGLEYAAALRMMALDIEGTEVYDAANVQCLAEQAVAGYANLERDAIACGSIGVPLALLASTAADLGQFVRYSLVELASSTSSRDSSPRYRLHPLLHAYATDCLAQFEPEIVHAAQCNDQTYASVSVEHSQRKVIQLDRNSSGRTWAARQNGQHTTNW